MKTLRLRDVKECAQGHTAQNGRAKVIICTSLSLNPSFMDGKEYNSWKEPPMGRTDASWGSAGLRGRGHSHSSQGTSLTLTARLLTARLLSTRV